MAGKGHRVLGDQLRADLVVGGQRREVAAGAGRHEPGPQPGRVPDGADDVGAGERAEVDEDGLSGEPDGRAGGEALAVDGDGLGPRLPQAVGHQLQVLGRDAPGPEAALPAGVGVVAGGVLGVVEGELDPGSAHRHSPGRDRERGDLVQHALPGVAKSRTLRRGHLPLEGGGLGGQLVTLGLTGLDGIEQLGSGLPDDARGGPHVEGRQREEEADERKRHEDQDGTGGGRAGQPSGDPSSSRRGVARVDGLLHHLVEQGHRLVDPARRHQALADAAR